MRRTITQSLIQVRGPHRHSRAHVPWLGWSLALGRAALAAVGDQLAPGAAADDAVGGDAVLALEGDQGAAGLGAELPLDGHAAAGGGPPGPPRGPPPPAPARLRRP